MNRFAFVLMLLVFPFFSSAEEKKGNGLELPPLSDICLMKGSAEVESLMTLDLVPAMPGELRCSGALCFRLQQPNSLPDRLCLFKKSGPWSWAFLDIRESPENEEISQEAVEYMYEVFESVMK